LTITEANDTGSHPKTLPETARRLAVLRMENPAEIEGILVTTGFRNTFQGPIRLQQKPAGFLHPQTRPVECGICSESRLETSRKLGRCQPQSSSHFIQTAGT